MDLKVGDVVKLKSGGPEMTIQELDAVNGMVDCIWFDGKTQRRDEFSMETVQKAGPRVTGVGGGRRVIR
jgi:uncharacterized protein YodC (DUF2158 family)